jgi:hypothetical protein
MAPARALVVPDLHAGSSGQPEERSRRVRIAAALARFGEADVERPRGELAHETAARLAEQPRREYLVVGGERDQPAVEVLLAALCERGLVARRFEAAVPADPKVEPRGVASVPRDPRCAAEERARALLHELGADPLLAVYAGLGLRERNADCLVNLR